MRYAIIPLLCSFFLAAPLARATDDLIQLPLSGSLAGIVNGQPAQGTTTGTLGFVPGRAGAQAALVGAADAIKLPSGRCWPSHTGCVEFWIQPQWDSSDGRAHWLLVDQAGNVKLFKHPSGRLYFQVRDGKQTLQCHVLIAWRKGEWHHLAATWKQLAPGADEMQLLLFVDGELSASAAGSIARLNVGSTLIVGNSLRGDEGAAAALADLRVRAAPHVGYQAAGSTAGENYALAAQGAALRVSSELAALKGKSYRGIELIDGRETGGYWCTDIIAKAPPPHWAEIDLGAERLVGQVVLYPFRKAGRTDRFPAVLEVRENDAWKKVASVEPARATADDATARYASASALVTIPVEPPRPMRQLRIVFDKTSSVRLHEIQVLPPRAAVARHTAKLPGQEALLRFDFGAHDSPLEDGWLPVDETTAFTADTDYGWKSRENLDGVDRSEGYSVTRDFVAGVARGKPAEHQFLVRLPNGKYSVAVLAGDLDYRVPAFALRAQGRLVADRVGTGGAGACAAQTFVVDVRNGLLQLGFAAPEAWLVSALIIAPLERFGDVQAGAEQVLEQFAKRSPALLRGWRQRQPSQQSGDLTVTAELRTRGYETFSRHYLNPIYPTTVPSRAEVCRRLDMQAAPGEFEPTTLALRAFQALRNVRLQAGALQGASSRIPAEQVEIKLVRCWPQVEEAWDKNEWMIVPELLEPQGSQGELGVLPDTTRQFWITVHVPDDAQPGAYRGTLTLSAENVPPTRIEVHLQVLPIKLAWPAGISRGIYYSPRQEDGDLQALNELRNMRAHGLNAVAIGLGPGFRLQKPDGPWDLKYLHWLMGLLERVGGFTGPVPLYLGGQGPTTAAKREAILSLIPTLEAERKEHQWPELLYYPVDEPFAGQRLEEAVPYLQVCKEVPGIRTYCTVSGLAAERLAPWLDVRCHTLTVTNGFVLPKVRDQALAEGDTFWWYSNATRHYFAPMRMKAGFFFWKSRATGQTYWHFQNYAGAPFCDFDGSSRDHEATYPGLTGPLETIQWECYREGLDDACYTYTLETLLATAAKKRLSGQAVAHARQALKDLEAAINVDLASYDAKHPYRRYAFHYFSDCSAEQFDAHRRRLAAAIVELQQALR